MGLRLADMQLFGLIVPSRGLVTSPIPRLRGMCPRTRSTLLGPGRKLLERRQLRWRHVGVPPLGHGPETVQHHRRARNPARRSIRVAGVPPAPRHGEADRSAHRRPLDVARGIGLRLGVALLLTGDGLTGRRVRGCGGSTATHRGAPHAEQLSVVLRRTARALESSAGLAEDDLHGLHQHPVAHDCAEPTGLPSSAATSPPLSTVATGPEPLRCDLLLEGRVPL